MRRIYWIGVLLLAACGLATGDESQWKAVISQSGRFSVRMPAGVEVSAYLSQEAGGTVQQYFYKATDVRGNTYVASCWDYTQAPKRALPPTELDDAAAAQRGSLAHRRASITRIRLGNAPGRELLLLREDGKTDVFRLYLTGRRLYSISAVLGVAEADRKNATALIDSFRLLPQRR
jgi:hypothetical protein